MPLTGDAWDDLYVKLDTAANTSEFFFNGTSFGVIPHGTTPSNAVGSVRIERLDRASANGDVTEFDSLSIGSVDMTPPRLHFVLTASTLDLSWAAERMGFTLQSRPSLATSAVWSPWTNGVHLANGQFAVSIPNISTGNLFFRLSSP
jgi:hypothetical protein